MSDSWMPFQPAIDEPSNPLPSSKKVSSTMRVGTVTCCSLPFVSVKRRSTNLTSFSLISLSTSAAVMKTPGNWLRDKWVATGRSRRPAGHLVCARIMQKACQRTSVAHICDAWRHPTPVGARLAPSYGATATKRAPLWSGFRASGPIVIRSAILCRPSRMSHPMAKNRAQPPRTFQDLILALQQYWARQGCALLQPYDMEMGAGTFHTATFLRAVGPEPWSAAYVQPSRRPTDGRYGENPFRVQRYYQYQVVIKPSPPNFIDLYLGSLAAVGIDTRVHDVRLVEDNWESPTLGAWGLGWEVWLNGMEVTQFTYFQQVGGLDCRPVMGEITYGLERLAMYLQGVESFFDLVWTDGPLGQITYRDVSHQNEVEQSRYNFELADVGELSRQFDACEKDCQRLLEAGVPLAAYERMLECSHTFNLLDARKAISVTERQRYILRVRTLARGVAEAYYASRETLGFPMREMGTFSISSGATDAASRVAGK